MNDNEILKFISDFEFIDNLIDEHLNANEIEVNKTEKTFVKRNPQEYFNFYKKLSNVHDIYDEYDKFIGWKTYFYVKYNYTKKQEKYLMIINLISK